MTYKELVKAVTRECHAGVTQRQVNTILICMWRIMLEELLADPYNSYVLINGIGRFYMNLTNFRNPISMYGKARDIPEGEDHFQRWVLKFRAFKKLKRVMWEQEDFKNLHINGYPLCPDEELNKVQERRKGERAMVDYNSPRRKKVYVTKRSISMGTNPKKISIKDKLPED